jgi:glycosyltransferase Alg8
MTRLADAATILPVPEAAGFLTRPHGLAKWTPGAVFGVLVYVGLVVIGLLALPSRLFDGVSGRVVVTVGGFAIWRFGWWSIHMVRALAYSRIVYPRMRRAADLVWATGARPRHLHFMVITFRERPEITTAVVRSIIGEVRATRLAATIWLGSGDAMDEDLIGFLVETEAADLPLDLVIARQDRPGKRYAIGIALRAMRRGDIDPADLAVFMDGDSIIAPGLITKCASLFLADPKLDALTTDEEGVVYGPRWLAHWLAMRFAQRRLAMQSLALSGKVLTLTGRLSLFRASRVVSRDFIDIVENDHLDHWLWGRFRFLSGDDKSTWYYVLSRGGRMTYVPDALSLTIEYIEGSGYGRMVHNLRRWSGNMLRNGGRAIALGPHRTGLFVWWCLVDQRIAMWTVLYGPLLALGGTIFLTPACLWAYVTWILATRLAQSMVLWLYSRRVMLSYPVLLYFNQLVNAVVKVYSLFRLSQQRWKNRGNQSAGFGTDAAHRARGMVASYLTTVAVVSIVVGVIAYTGLLRLPSSYTVVMLLGRGGGR